MQHKCETIKEATEKQRKKLSEKKEEMEERKKRIEGAKEEVRKEEEERKRDINMIFNELRDEVEIQRQKMIERCEMISKRKGSSFSSFHYYYYFFEHKQNKTTEKAIEEYLQELKEEEVLEMAEIEIKAVERVIGETEVGVCSCGPTLNDRVTSFLLFQVFSFILFSITHM